MYGLVLNPAQTKRKLKRELELDVPYDTIKLIKLVQRQAKISFNKICVYHPHQDTTQWLL